VNTALLLIGSGCLVCLLPLALYLLFLASLNKRPHPTLLNGRWDLACLLLGLSGFLLVGGPVLLSAFDSRLRATIFEGNFGHIRQSLHPDATLWSILAGIYVAILAATILLLIRSRGRVAVIYNLAFEDTEHVLAAVFERLHLPWRKRSGIFEVGSLPNDGTDPTGKTAPPANGESPFRMNSLLEVNAFPAMHHVTLRWSDEDPQVRRAVEVELDRTFPNIASPPNPAGGWFITASVALFLVMFVCMGFLIFWLMFTSNPP
jgi:hypothetical protein